MIHSKGEKLAAAGRVHNLQDLVDDLLFHTTSTYYDEGEVDYCYAQSMAKINRAKGLLESIEKDITNKYIVNTTEDTSAEVND